MIFIIGNFILIFLIIYQVLLVHHIPIHALAAIKWTSSFHHVCVSVHPHVTTWDCRMDFHEILKHYWGVVLKFVYTFQFSLEYDNNTHTLYDVHFNHNSECLFWMQVVNWNASYFITTSGFQNMRTKENQSVCLNNGIIICIYIWTYLWEERSPTQTE